VAAFHRPSGAHAGIVLAAFDGRFTAVLSPAIVKELANVLRTDFRWPEESVQRALRDVATAGEVICPRTRIHVLTDPDDNRILECAVDGQANLIVSNDHHLLSLKEWQGIPIIAAPDFRRMITPQPRRTTK
jgi:putative PIN family toxin of toxin-antitoxin system